MVWAGIHMPDMNGNKTVVLVQQHSPFIQVLALSLCDDHQAVQRITKWSARAQTGKNFDLRGQRYAPDCVRKKANTLRPRPC